MMPEYGVLAFMAGSLVGGLLFLVCGVALGVVVGNRGVNARLDRLADELSMQRVQRREPLPPTVPLQMMQGRK